MSKRLELLRRYQDNAGCRYPGPQRKARKVWRKLRKYLTESQRIRLVAEASHVRIGEGRGGLDYECEKIREAWAEDG